MLRSLLLGGVSALVMTAAVPVAAMSPVPADTEGVFSFTAKLEAQRNLPKSDTGAFSNYKADRTVTVTCEMQAIQAGGVGPDGESSEQQALGAEAEAAGAKAERESRSGQADAAALQREIQACGNDQACQMRVAMQMMNDPRMQNAQQSAMRAQETMAPSSGAYAAALTAPLWQRWFAKVDSESCSGEITFNDFEDFDRGFVAAGRGTSPGTRTVKGKAAIGGTHPELWFDLENGRRQFTIPIASYAADVTVQDTYSGTSVENMSLVSGIGRMQNELMKIGPEGAPSMGGTGSKTFMLDGGADMGRWRGTLTVSWNFRP